MEYSGILVKFDTSVICNQLKSFKYTVEREKEKDCSHSFLQIIFLLLIQNKKVSVTLTASRKTIQNFSH